MVKAKESPVPWAANQIERRATVSLLPYAKNARTHSGAQVDQLAASMREFGFTAPVLVDDTGVIVAGHGRVLAAKQLGLAHIPVIVVPSNWSAEKRRAYVLADNKLALNAEWDADVLAHELAALKAAEMIGGDLDFSFTTIGFSDDDLARLLDDGDQKKLTDIADDAEDKDQEGPVVGAAAGDETTSFSTPLTHDEATIVHAAIRSAKRLGSHGTTGEALAAICQEWSGWGKDADQ